MLNWFGNATSVTSEHWEPQPTQRGTFGILSSCLTTLVLCLWSALHLNIPAQGHRKTQIATKIAWLLVGLFAPEMVLATALLQRRVAHKLTKSMWKILGQKKPAPKFSIGAVCRSLGRCFRRSPKTKMNIHGSRSIGEEELSLQKEAAVELNELSIDVSSSFSSRILEEQCMQDPNHSVDETQDTQDEPIPGSSWSQTEQVAMDEEEVQNAQDSTPRLHGRAQWTHTHSFFALMGGFVFDTSTARHPFLPFGKSRLTLTPKGVNWLKKNSPDLLPDLKEDDIKDKSKADGFLKAIICLQASWFCVQCITRITQGLAISLLELNVFGHAICALMVYASWWDKPLDIVEPVLLQSEEAHEICAMMCMTSSAKSDHIYTPLRLALFFLTDNRVKIVDQVPEFSTGVPFGQRSEMSWGSAWHLLADNIWTIETAESNEYTISIAQVPSTAVEQERHDDGSITLRDGEVYAGFQISCPSRQPPLEFDLPTIDCRRWQLCSRAIKRHNVRFRDDPKASFAQGVSDRNMNWPDVDIVSENGGEAGLNFLILLATVVVAPTVYGAAHVLAWNAPFQSVTEMRYWRMSSATITATAGFLVTLISMGYIVRWMDNREQIRRSKLWNELGLVILGLCMLVGVVFHAFCRAYLVVESFKQLAYLPPSAYQLPTWSVYLPHIG